jgi:hypothetical protein
VVGLNSIAEMITVTIITMQRQNTFATEDGD